MTSKKTAPNLQLQQVRISDQIADHIVRYIAEHKLEPGQSLPSEGELTRLFGVSRPTVREATNALAGRGLIAVSSGKSPTVLPLSKVPFSNLAQHGLATQQITPIQILEVRHSLDLQAAVLAAEHRTPDDIERISAIVTQMPAALSNVEAFSPLDAAFHEAVGKATQNPLLSAIISGISAILFDSTRSVHSHTRNQDEWDSVLRNHQNIAAAIINGNASAARRLVDIHYVDAYKRYD
ncbi:FadR/GntR family transcriptional regulator [Herbaspirillum sp. B65]|uniref:FadR/GntR family transcriptional regulator n=1 Tax=Herbaspirillum sp. B65 TaxID=137708 RepID=UPI00034BED00|nr:FadR/GntR family transcriptional regulator [Herbaspirillum sp. B65]